MYDSKRVLFNEKISMLLYDDYHHTDGYYNCISYLAEILNSCNLLFAMILT